VARVGTTVDEIVFVTPLSQANFLPDLMQVKVLFPTIDLLPTLVHLVPALAKAFPGMMRVDRKRESIEKEMINLLFISSYILLGI
jgi:hypothetical protein